MDRRTKSDARSAVLIGSPGGFGERWLVHESGHGVSVIDGPCKKLALRLFGAHERKYCRRNNSADKLHTDDDDAHDDGSDGGRRERPTLLFWLELIWSAGTTELVHSALRKHRSPHHSVLRALLYLGQTKNIGRNMMATFTTGCLLITALNKPSPMTLSLLVALQAGCVSHSNCKTVPVASSRSVSSSLFSCLDADFGCKQLRRPHMYTLCSFVKYE